MKIIIPHEETKSEDIQIGFVCETGPYAFFERFYYYRVAGVERGDRWPATNPFVDAVAPGHGRLSVRVIRILNLKVEKKKKPFLNIFRFVLRTDSRHADGVNVRFSVETRAREKVHK